MHDALPGGDLIEKGLADLREGRETIEALLVAIGAPRLRRIGLDLPEDLPNDPEHRLYSLLAADTCKTMLNSNGESGHPCLVPDVRGKAFNFSPLRIMFAEGLSYIAFIMLRYVPSILAFLRVFIINGY